MRKKLLVVLSLLLCAVGFSQGVVVNTSSYGNANATQLVNNVLVNHNCLAQTANITKSTGLSTVNYAQGNSIGYFTNSNSAFPMASGVVLVTGDAATASGPNTSISTDTNTAATNWVGDADLQAAFAAAGITLNSMNATVLEFDFTAATPNLSIPYIFASEEYGQYQCSSKDGFAILLKVAGAPNSSYQNIATIPGTTGTPVSVSTIRNSAYNSACASVNPEYYGVFNGGGSASTAATNFEGQTVQMNATATLTPGTTYHIKIVIADDGNANPNNPNANDTRYNSAVFFPAGGFNLGQNVVGNSLTLAANTALCEGETLTINTQLPTPQYTLSWTKDTAPVAGGSTINITESGLYALSITNPATNCTVTESVNIEFAPQLTPGPANTLYACPDGPGTYTFNLALNTPSLKQGLDPATVVTYHATQAAADAGTGALNATYTVSVGTTIYARVKSYNSNCYVVVPFAIETIPATTATAPAAQQLCETTMGAGTAVVNLTAQNATILGSQSAANYTVSYYTSEADANAATSPITGANSYTTVTTPAAPTQTIWVRVQSLQSTACFAVTSFTITVNPIPQVSTQNNITVCGSYTLPTIQNGNYYTATGGTGTQLAAGAQVTTTQTIYIYAVNTATGCSNESSFTVTVLQGSAAPVPDNVEQCNSYTLPALQSGQEYRTAANGGGTVLPPGSVITTTQNVYFYIPSAPACTADTYFTVTIITADDPADVYVCSSYTLPALTNGTYHTEPNGAGNTLATGTVINTNQTIYVYNHSNAANCSAENSFTVNIAPVITPRTDIVRCGNFALPDLTIGNYYTGAGGTGTMLPVGTNILTTQTVYIYYLDTASGCSSEDDFLITINTKPFVSNIPDVTACGSYTLPANAQIDGYYTGIDGTGTFYPVGSVITSSMTIRATKSPNEFGCWGYRTFTITILDTTAETPGNQTACTSYTLPALAAGNYYTGPNGTGTQLPVSTVITTSQTIYVHAVSTTTPQCTSDGSFTVTIIAPPALPDFSNVIMCGSYTLPALANGNYFTGPDGTGTQLAAGTAITTSQTVYVYRTTNTTPQCSNQKQFNVTIINGSIAPANATSCGSYTLPALTVGNYYTAPGGGGTQLAAGSQVTTNQTIYVYTPVTSGTNCTTNNSFTVTITNTPSVDNPADVVACNSYTLPALTSGSYYTGANGTGTMLPVGSVITATQTIYVYNSNPGCSAQNDFQVIINNITVPTLTNQVVCQDPGFALPTLANGSYYTMSGGPSTAGNQALPEGTVISDLGTTTIYVYDYLNGTNPVCFAESSFTVTVNANPLADDPGVVASCNSYTLPALTNGAYYTQSGGQGAQLNAGDVISSSTTLYIYAESGGTPNCITENEMQILVNPEPPVDVAACDSYALPVLPAGQQYRTAAAGGGTEIAAGTVINATQTVYFYIPSAAECTQNTSFVVTINVTPDVLPVADATNCDSYVLPALTVGNYYTASGGPTGGGQVIPAGTEIFFPDNLTPADVYTQEIYVYAETGTTPNCSDEESFTLTLYKTPLTDARSDVEICDVYTFGALSQYNHYYSVSGGPDAAGQTEYFAGDTLSTNADPVNGTTIYIYSASPVNPDCFNESSYTVTIYSANVDTDMAQVTQGAGANYYATYNSVTNVANVEACDTYTLPDLNVGGTSPTDTFTQQFYTLAGGPNTAGQQALTDLTITTSQTVYLYRQLIGRVDCDDEAEINIVINQTPVVDDSQGDFSECFSYTLPALAVGNYFNSPGGVDPITDLTIETSQMVYVYAQTGTNFICTDEHSYFLTINHIDVPNPVDPLACDSYTLPQLALPGTRYFEQPGGPGVAGQVEHLVGEVLAPGTYNWYVWAETNTTPNCTDEEDITIIVVPRPVANMPTALETCAINDAGTQGMFDLTASIAEAIGGQVNVEAFVYETEADANWGTNAVPDPANYHNLPGSTQTVWIRVQSTVVGTCYDIVQLQLTVHPRPIAVDPIGPYEVCDNGQSDIDGIGVFNLSTYQDDVLGSLSPVTHTVTYYATLADVTGGLPIPSPTNYTTASTTVYLKVTINATGCYDVVPLQLIVNPLPVVVNPTPYSLCDETNPEIRDEHEVFDLTSKVDEIVQGADGYTATFFTVLADAEANSGASQILNPEAYTNTTTVEAIYVRITDNETGCYRVVLMDIRVEPLPQLTTPTADMLTTCSTDNDGFGIFDLNEIADEMLNGAPNTVIEFYTTLINAQNDLNPVQNWNAFSTDNAFTDYLYVVATNTVTGCRSIVYTLTLTVNPAPVNVDIEDLTLCDQDANGQNNSTIFDLTVQDAEINTQLGAAAGDYTIHYFVSEAFAIAGAPRITNPAVYTGTNGQMIYVRIENPDTECYIVTSFELHINQPQALANPTPLVVCEDALPNDGFTTVDLTVKDDEILTPFGVGESNLVQYFTDAAYTNLVADPTQFTNTVNPQLLYVLVTTPQGCTSTTTLTVIVKPLPTPDTTPDTLTVCDEVTIGDGIEEFDLTDAAADILNGDSQSTLTFYTTLADAEADTNAIPDPTSYFNAVAYDDVVYVRVTLTGSEPNDPGCYAIVTLPLHVDPVAPIYNSTGVVPHYAICNDPTTGFEQFNLIEHLNGILTAAGENPLDYTIRFYVDQLAVDNNTPLPYLYTNTQAGQQQIIVVVTNNTTGCRIQTTLMLYAEQAAVANPVDDAGNNPMVECDYDGDNDGYHVFDLTPAGAEALGTQNPTQYTVEYYTTEAAAIAGDTTVAEYIATPAAFTNTEYLGQTIWIRVTNTATNAPCFALTTFEVRVSLLPEPVIESDDNDTTICVDFVTGDVYKPVYLHANNTDAATSTYQWQFNGVDIPGATSQDYTAEEEGLYTVTVWNADSCQSGAVQAFEVFLSGPASPITSTGYVVSNAFGDNQTITVLVDGFGDYQYTLAPEDAQGSSQPLGPWQNSNVFHNVQQGYFTIYVRDLNTLDVNPCDMFEITGVSVIDYPKYFTPNGDGINDYWNIVGMINHPEANIFIFDRYGKLIKQLSPLSRTDMDQGWDGTYNGQPLPSDDYWFRVEFTEGGNQRVFKAHFTLKR